MSSNEINAEVGAQSSGAKNGGEQHEADFGQPVHPRLAGWQLLLKRVFDLTVTIAVLPLAVVLGLISAILIRVDSPGAVFFTQRRIGQNGRPFLLYKFRSMYRLSLIHI